MSYNSIKLFLINVISYIKFNTVVILGSQYWELLEPPISGAYEFTHFPALQKTAS